MGFANPGGLGYDTALMRTLCAWCGTTIAEGVPGDHQVSHGICPRCAGEWRLGDSRYAVIPADRSFLYSEIQNAFQGIRGIQVILDRRQGERRRQRDLVREDRRGPSQDRRQQTYLVVGALPTVAGLRLPAGRLSGLTSTGNLLAPPKPRALRISPPRPALHSTPA